MRSVFSCARATSVHSGVRKMLAGLRFFARADHAGAISLGTRAVQPASGLVERVTCSPSLGAPIDERSVAYLSFPVLALARSLRSLNRGPSPGLAALSAPRRLTAFAAALARHSKAAPRSLSFSRARARDATGPHRSPVLQRQRRCRRGRRG